jgi:hypothetical protein
MIQIETAHIENENTTYCRDLPTLAFLRTLAVQAVVYLENIQIAHQVLSLMQVLVNLYTTMLTLELSCRHLHPSLRLIRSIDRSPNMLTGKHTTLSIGTPVSITANLHNR